MRVEISRPALDRVPLSIIFDDSTLLVNLNYFFMRDRNPIDGQRRRWEDVPVVHPESFTREFAEYCLDEGVKGKFSVVPCPGPAALGRIDHGLPLFSRAQQESWLDFCRELIVPKIRTRKWDHLRGERRKLRRIRPATAHDDCRHPVNRNPAL